MNNKCTAFVYNVSSQFCALKNPPERFLRIVQLKDEEGSIFGPQYCPGRRNYINLFQHKMFLNIINDLDIENLERKI